MDKNKKKDLQEEEHEEEVEEQAEAEEVNEEVELLKQQLEEAENKYRRAIADYQNLQKRSQEERQEWIRTSNKELLLRFLPVLDTLFLANKHINDKGIEVTINQFLDVLKAEGVIRVQTEGKEFDPHTMECVVTESGAENKVLEELRAGYLLNDKVIRPAQVKVGNGEKAKS